LDLMPVYYFHLDEDDDDSGTELADDAAAHREARETFGAMIRDSATMVDAEMRVVDAAGRRIVTLRFSAA